MRVYHRAPRLLRFAAVWTVRRAMQKKAGRAARLGANAASRFA